MDSHDGPLGHHYGVTNYHVAKARGYSCIRVNTLNGPDVFEFGPEDWIHDPGKDDIAVIPLVTQQGGLIVTWIGQNYLLHEKAVEEEAIGPGDDIFMVGRFVDLDNKETNKPALRFGNISTFPIKVEQSATGYPGLSYCIDMHSRTGYSGSPVFVYRTLGSTLQWAAGRQINAASSLLCLLGIHWGQFPEKLKIKREIGRLSEEVSTEGESYEYIVGMSGMTLVIPAWRITELLNRDDLVELRKKEEAMREKRVQKEDSMPPVSEVADSSEAPSKKEIAKATDETLRTMLGTPPRPHAKPERAQVKRK